MTYRAPTPRDLAARRSPKERLIAQCNSADQLTETEEARSPPGCLRADEPGDRRRLVLSPKTVEVNLNRIYRKLGVRSRTALAARFAGERVERRVDET